jgi:uncharacterized protein YbbK (DUF523 family)
MNDEPRPIRLGISRCLLGDEVRYDGGHKRDDFLVDVLGRYVEWVPICPEVEAGMGIPREPIHLVGDPRNPRLQTVRGQTDVTGLMAAFTERKISDLQALELSGFVFKKGSPSCGIEQVKILNRHGMPGRNGTGLFARAFMEHFPMIPVEEEGRALRPRAPGKLYRTHFLLSPVADAPAPAGHPASRSVIPYDP